MNKYLNLEDFLYEESSALTELRKNSDVKSEIEIKVLRCLQGIGMRAFVDIYFPALRLNPDVKVSDLVTEYPESSTFSKKSQNSRLSKAKKIFEDGSEWIALRIISDSYHVDALTHKKAEMLLKKKGEAVRCKYGSSTPYSLAIYQ